MVTALIIILVIVVIWLGLGLRCIAKDLEGYDQWK